MQKKPLTIVLTGGPCGGKSTIINFLKEELSALGHKVFTVAETATEVHASGIDLGSNKQRILQSLILGLQLCKEDTVRAMANLHVGSRAVILLDRGAVDAQAYINQDDFEYVASTQGLTKFDLLHRYDAVLHLRSVAYDLPHLYHLVNNEARSESFEDAKVVDSRTLNAWIGTPHLRIFGNAEGFPTKERRVLAEVKNLLSDEPVEVESKWLVDSESARAFLRKSGPYTVLSVPITQSYLLDGSRIRRRGNYPEVSYTLTLKKEVRPGVSTEVEETITGEQYQYYLSEHADPKAKAIMKIRHMFVWGDRYWELDEFKKIGKDLKTLEFFMMETEFSPEEIHELENNSLETPPFLRMLRDVTKDSAFKNKNLAFNGLPESLT